MPWIFFHGPTGHWNCIKNRVPQFIKRLFTQHPTSLQRIPSGAASGTERKHDLNVSGFQPLEPLRGS